MAKKTRSPIIGETVVLQSCKHRWLNGLEAEVLELRGTDEFVVRSTEGRHIVGLKNLLMSPEG